MMARDGAGGTNGRVEVTAGAADPPEGGGIADETFKGPDGISYRRDLPEHLRGPDGFTEAGRLNGTHNLDEARAALDRQGVSYTLQPTGTPGISEIKYQVYNKSLGGFETIDKTVYDPRVYSDTRMLEMAQEDSKAPFEKFVRTLSPADRIQDVVQDGVKFRVYMQVDKATGAPIVGNVQFPSWGRHAGLLHRSLRRTRLARRPGRGHQVHPRVADPRPSIG